MTGATGPTYMTWNDALASRFFNPGASGEQVYLYVTEEVVADVGNSIGGADVEDFVDAVRSGPPGTTRTGHCQRALQIAQGWREREFRYPPYVAYLALFVLAGGHEGDFAPHAYYPRLWELLGEPGEGSPPSFDRMIELWDDLETWSTRDCEGKLGIFEARIVGNWIHVGLPLAQTVLTEAERAALPRIFGDAQLEPGPVPANRHLQRALVQWGRASLRARTLGALERGSESFKQALLDIVAEDFLAWDGQLPRATQHEAGQVHAGLRLCLAVDRVARAARVTVRCHSSRALPDEGLTFDGGAAPFRCVEAVPGWSSELILGDPTDYFTPPASAWSSGLALHDGVNGWRVRLGSARVRVFVEGASDGLPGLIETVAVPADRPFYLAFQDADGPALQEWAESDCTGWRELGIQSGLPAGWRLAAADSATTDRGVRLVEPSAAFPDRVIVRLLGGIRSSGTGNSYFWFAPPRVAVDGASQADEVYCDGRCVDQDTSTPGLFYLPGDLPTDSRLVVEVRRAGEVIRRQSLYLVSGSPWRLETPQVAVDSFGTVAPSEGRARAVSGAIVPASDKPLPPDPLRLPGLPTAAAQVYFVGNRRGAISVWPRDGLPAWEPVWAIPFAQRGKALYCAASLSDATLLPERAGSRKHLTTWHRVLWKSRKRITPPADRALRKLWRQYQDSARDV